MSGTNVTSSIVPAIAITIQITHGIVDSIDTPDSLHVTMRFTPSGG